MFVCYSVFADATVQKVRTVQLLTTQLTFGKKKVCMKIIDLLLNIMVVLYFFLLFSSFFFFYKI